MSIPKDSYTHEALMKYAQAEVASREFGGLTGTEVYEHAWRMLEAMYHDAHPSPAPKKLKQEEKLTPLPGLGGAPCLTHREKRHVFSDGTVWECCSHFACGWGRTRKTHSDGMEGGTLYAGNLCDIDPVVDIEAEEDVPSEDTQELTVEAWAGAEPTMTEDGDEIDSLPFDADPDEQLEDELCEAS